MNPTVLIGLDGATFTILDHVMENGSMPFLKEFVQTGVRADLTSTVVPLTPPAWVTLMTGRNPGNHGVLDFIWAEERKNDVYFTLYNYRDIQCESIWSIISRQNGAVCSLNFPMMSPPPEVSGYIVPGLVSWKHLRRNVYPPQFYDELKSITGFNAKELAWDFNMEKKASKGVPEADYESWLEFHIRRENQWFEVVRYLMKKERNDLTAIVFDGADKISHIGWRFLDLQFFPESPSAWEQKIRKLCLEYFRRLDDFLSEIVQLAGPETRFFMASDHGFGPSRYVFRVNSWLHEQGYLCWKEHEELDEKSRRSIKRLVDNHFVDLDWNKTVAYARTTTSNGIYIRVAGQAGQSGIAIDQYASFRSQLIEKLLAVTHPDTGERIVQRVFTKEEAYPGKNSHQAPDLTLVMSDYSFISILNKMPVICPRPEIEGTHYPAGIFMANGPGIRQAMTLAPIPIVDISPILLYSLGLEIPSDLEGRLPDGVFEDSYIEEHPYRVGKATQAPDSYALRTHQDAAKEDDEEIYKRLKMLGYLE